MIFYVIRNEDVSDWLTVISMYVWVAIFYLIQNSRPSCKKLCATTKEAIMTICKIQDDSQEMAVMVG